jgi:hypothetical protein
MKFFTILFTVMLTMTVAAPIEDSNTQLIQEQDDTVSGSQTPEYRVPTYGYEANRDWIRIGQDRVLLRMRLPSGKCFIYLWNKKIQEKYRANQGGILIAIS